MIQCYLDMHKPSTTRKTSVSRQERRAPNEEPHARQSRLSRREQRSGRGVNAQGGSRLDRRERLALPLDSCRTFYSLLSWLGEGLKISLSLSFSPHTWWHSLLNAQCSTHSQFSIGDRDLAQFLLFLRKKKKENIFCFLKYTSVSCSCCTILTASNKKRKKKRNFFSQSKWLSG